MPNLTIYAPGYTASAPFVATGLSVSSEYQDLGIPYYDEPSQTVLYRHHNFIALSDDNNPGTLFWQDQQNELIWQGIKNDPVWEGLIYPPLDTPNSFKPGTSDFIAQPYMISLDLTLDIEGPAINKWFPDGEFEKIGYMCFMSAAGVVLEQHWINFKQQTFAIRRGDYSDGYKVYLLPGCFASGIAHSKLFPPQLLVGGGKYPAVTGHPYDL